MATNEQIQGLEDLKGKYHALIDAIVELQDSGAGIYILSRVQDYANSRITDIETIQSELEKNL